MSLEEVKTQIARLPTDQQDQLAAFLVHLRHRRSPGALAETSARLDDNNPASWLCLDELKEKWKD